MVLDGFLEKEKNMLKLDLSKARQFVSEEEMANFKAQTLLAKEILLK